MFLMVRNSTFSNNKKTGDSEFTVVQFNTGLDIKYSEEINLLFGAGIYRFNADFTAKNPIMTMEIDAESTYLSLSAGISRKY
jgi:hypothetical protein